MLHHVPLKAGTLHSLPGMPAPLNLRTAHEIPRYRPAQIDLSTGKILRPAAIPLTAPPALLFRASRLLPPRGYSQIVLSGPARCLPPAPSLCWSFPSPTQDVFAPLPSPPVSARLAGLAALSASLGKKIYNQWYPLCYCSAALRPSLDQQSDQPERTEGAGSHTSLKTSPLSKPNSSYSHAAKSSQPGESR